MDDKGDATGYKDVSIADIVDKQNVFELCALQQWISKQLLVDIGWDLTKPITYQMVADVFANFHNKKIKTFDFKYMPENEDDSDE